MTKYYPKYPKTGISQLSDCFGTWVRPHSMWNVMLKTLDYFLCFSRHDLGFLGSVSPNYPTAHLYTCIKQVYITQPSESLDTRVKVNLMWNVELTFGLLFMSHFIWFDFLSVCSFFNENIHYY